MYMYQSSLEPSPPCPFRRLIPNLCCDVSFMELHLLSFVWFHLLLSSSFLCFFVLVHALISLPTSPHPSGPYVHVCTTNQSFGNANSHTGRSGIMSKPSFLRLCRIYRSALSSFVRKWHCTSRASFPPSLLTKKKESDFDCRMHVVGDPLSNIATIFLLIP
ncbi:hypothetical protein V8C34DRAFT_20404 [Trichoderma compactum]